MVSKKPCDGEGNVGFTKTIKLNTLNYTWAHDWYNVGIWLNGHGRKFFGFAASREGGSYYQQQVIYFTKKDARRIYKLLGDYLDKA